MELIQSYLEINKPSIIKTQPFGDFNFPNAPHVRSGTFYTGEGFAIPVDILSYKVEAVREAMPIYSMGSPAPRSFSRGPRSSTVDISLHVIDEVVGQITASDLNEVMIHTGQFELKGIVTTCRHELVYGNNVTIVRLTIIPTEYFRVL